MRGNQTAAFVLVLSALLACKAFEKEKAKVDQGTANAPVATQPPATPTPTAAPEKPSAAPEKPAAPKLDEDNPFAGASGPTEMKGEAIWEKHYLKMRLAKGWEQSLSVGYPLATAPNEEAAIFLMGDQSAAPARNHANAYASYGKFKANNEDWTEARDTTFGSEKAELRQGKGTLFGEPAKIWVVYFPVEDRKIGVAGYVSIADGADQRLQEAADMLRTLTKIPR
jgi:hypothetical protein